MAGTERSERSSSSGRRIGEGGPLEPHGDVEGGRSGRAAARASGDLWVRQPEERRALRSARLDQEEGPLRVVVHTLPGATDGTPTSDQIQRADGPRVDGSQFELDQQSTSRDLDRTDERETREPLVRLMIDRVEGQRAGAGRRDRERAGIEPVRKGAVRDATHGDRDVERERDVDPDEASALELDGAQLERTDRGHDLREPQRALGGDGDLDVGVRLPFRRSGGLDRDRSRRAALGSPRSRSIRCRRSARGGL